MASYHGNTHSEPAKMEQIITEFFSKSLHIILESRCPYVSSRNYSDEPVLSSPLSSSSSSSFRPRDKWFNLALKDCPATLENIDFWRQSNLEPMIVDVILTQKPSNWDPLNFSPGKGLVRNLSEKERYYYGSDNDEFGCEAKSEKIVERWLLQYESKKTGGNGSGSKRSNCTSSGSLYKKSILLLRSLYATVRLLPAYKLFRDLISSAQIRSYNLGHRISNFVEPFTCREEADMQRFVFTPVETSCGRLCLSVLYHSSVLDVSSDPSAPLSPQFIPEYVGSPMAEPLKRFPSIPISKSSPSSSSPFGRRHTWSYDLYRASPPSVNPSPSPTFSDSHRSNRLPPAGSPQHLHDDTSAVSKFPMKNQTYDEYCPSPLFSPSPSPSPPTYVPGSPVFKVLSQSESAPLSVPTSRLSNVPSLPNNQMMCPPSPMKATRPAVSQQESIGLYQTSSTLDKLLSFTKDEPRRNSSLKPSSSSSPSKSFSRSSSRLSFQDDYDDSEFSGPFVVDDDDMADQCSRPGSFDQARHVSEADEVFLVKRSQDAAVGALVHMLKKAPPLRQDISVTVRFLQASKNEKLKSNCLEQEHSGGSSVAASSALVSSKTTADALEELCGYREMKDLLLKKG